jgi:hypothetical protein
VLMPPLSIDDAELDALLEITYASIREVTGDSRVDNHQSSADGHAASRGKLPVTGDIGNPDQ